MAAAAGAVVEGQGMAEGLGMAAARQTPPGLAAAVEDMMALLVRPPRLSGPSGLTGLCPQMSTHCLAVHFFTRHCYPTLLNACRELEYACSILARK